MKEYNKNNNKVFIIAEAGVNHNGSLANAKKMVDVAKDCNVDAVKFQTFTTDEVVTKSAPKAEYQKVSSTGKTQHEMIAELELSKEEFIELKAYCDSKDILFLASPFDLGSLDFLISKLDLPAIKIASGEITNAPLLYRASFSGKPIILSTGMCTLNDIEEALGVLAFGYTDKQSTPGIDKFKQAYKSEVGQIALKDKVVLLHCTSSYPTPYDEVNLNAIKTLRQAFGLPVGYSDHTMGIYASIGAISHEAKVIEKHFTLDKTQVGPDHSSSLSPDELNELVKGIRTVEQCQGNERKVPTISESGNIQICRRSLVARKSINKGEKFSQDSISAKRPGTGISPMHYWEWLDEYAKRNYQADEIIL